MKLTFKKATSGTYFERIEKNIKNGFKYPEAIVVTNRPSGKYGNIQTYYHFDGIKFNIIGSIPTWSNEKEECNKYHYIYKKIKTYKLDWYSLQNFMSQAKIK